MKHVNKEHALRIKEMTRILRFKEHYMMSPTKSRRSTERAGESFDTSFMRFTESFQTNFLKPRTQSFDSINKRKNDATIVEENA